MTGRWPFTAEKIATRLKLIEPFIFQRRELLPNFRLLPLPEAMVSAPICADPSTWEEIEHESYWGKSDLNFVLKNHFRVPDDWDDKNLAIHLPLGVLGDIFNHPEALVHIDAQPVASADRYHHTVPLDPSLQDGASHILSLHGWTGHAGWPPDRKSKAKLFMGRCELVQRNPELLAFHRKATSVLEIVRALDPSDAKGTALLAALDQAFITLDTRAPLGEAFYASVAHAAAVLDRDVAEVGEPLDVTLHGIGHAHMDVAYLWPVSQIRLKNARTYSNVLRLMEADDGYHFSHSQPQLYEYTRQDYPQIFERIKQRVKEGRWEVMGGMWVEPDLNVPSGEALVRQLMLGRQYFESHFGDVETPALWLPDTFGFPGQIPQLMRHAGLKWFLTNKLNWNQKNRIPSTTHHWDGIDGSRVLAHVLTTPRPVQYLPFPTNYKSDLTAPEVLGSWTNSSAPDEVRDLPVCYGYGDGGGGPTEYLLAKAHIYSAMPGMPKFKMSTVRATMERIEQSASALPVWTGEHYLEGHRGTLTSQAWIKRANRKAEWALHNAEALAAIADTQPDLQRAWELLCLNQFHDIVTGTSVSEVFEDARADFAEIAAITERCTHEALAAIGGDEPSVFNLSPVNGSRLVLLPDHLAQKGQRTEEGTLVLFAEMPAYSQATAASAALPSETVTASMRGGSAVLENPFLQVEISSDGQLSAVFDKISKRSVLAERQVGNQLQAFEDRPICWDAWDIDPFIEDRMEIIDSPCELVITENGPLRACVQVKRTWRNSEIIQDIQLAAHSPRLDFVTRVDWHETHTLLKAAFPTCVTSDMAEFDIQWGTIERSTSRDSDFDAARYEVAAQKWARLTEDDYSVALLNDCKYGYDVRSDTIRITLIKSATYPDPNADQGHHEFTYSLLPLPGADRAELDRQAYDLNVPVVVSELAPSSAFDTKPFVRSTNSAVIIETVKPSSDRLGVIVRLFEGRGTATNTNLAFAKDIEHAERVDFLERTTAMCVADQNELQLDIQSYEIVSLKVRFAK
ncbi:MAG: glycoside hydrolase family 38 C-terminal domain-containing protein [Pseudomonadota bacterium]